MISTSKRENSLGLKKLIYLSLLAIGGLTAISFYGYVKQRQSLETSQWVHHTQNLLNQLNYLESQIYEVGISYRGYVITGQHKYKQLSRKNFELINQKLTQIKEITSDNKKQQSDISRVQEHVDTLLGFYQKTIVLVESNQTHKAIKLVSSGSGQNIIDELKTLISRMRRREELLLNARIEKDEINRSHFNILLLTATLSAAFFLIFTLYWVWREFIQRLRIQEKLFESSQWQNAMLNSTPFPLVAATPDGIINLFNDAAQRLLGYTLEEVKGKTPAIWHDPDEIAAMADKLSSRFGEKIEAGFETFIYRARNDIIESDIWTYIKKNGSRVKVSLTVTALKNTQGDIIGYIGIAYDLTKQLQYEKAIIDAKEQALAGTQAKSEFLANMSHEIRTPMNAILGMAELLMESNLGEEQKKYVEIFQRSGQSLLNIINDILDISKIEAGHLELDHSPFNLTVEVQKAVEMMEYRIRQKNLKLTVDIQKDMNDQFVGDAHRIRQILLNLLGNSVKFTREGQITVRVRAKGKREHLQQILLEVQDTGIGMSQENTRKLFERFTQADTSITKEFGGSGLGLSIAKRLAELMKGNIKVESVLHKGSVFSVTLFLEAAEGEVQTQSPAYATSISASEEISILLVDDHAENRLLIKTYLKNLPYQVVEARNGREALELTKNKEFSLILMDMQMPVMDGYSATREIREREAHSFTAPTPILALTAYALKEEKDKSLLAGCNGHLTKPISKKTLLEVIQHYTAPLHLKIDEELVDLIPDYLENRKKELIELKALLLAEDYPAIESLGHKLKGSAASYGFGFLTEVGAQLEEHAQGGRRLNIEQAIGEYQQYLRRIKITYA